MGIHRKNRLRGKVNGGGGKGGKARQTARSGGKVLPCQRQGRKRAQRVRRRSGKRNSWCSRCQTAGCHNCADGSGNSLAGNPVGLMRPLQPGQKPRRPSSPDPAAKRNHREPARIMPAVRRKRECASAAPAWPKATKTVPLRQRNDVNRREGVRLLPVWPCS